MKRFRVTFSVTVDLDVAEGLLDEVVKPDWQREFYKLPRPEDVAAHLAYNVAHNHAELTSLDGFAHRRKDDMKVVREQWDEEDSDEIEILNEGKRS